MSVYFIFRSSIPRKNKIIIAGTMVTVIIIGAAYSSVAGITVVNVGPFNSNDFWIGFVSFAAQLRFDSLIILFLVPLIVGLLFTSSKSKHAESIMVLIGGMLFAAPLLTGFTELTNQPYRFVPLVTFFAVGVGVLLSKRTSLLSS